MATLFAKSKGGPAEKAQLMKLLKFIVDGTRNDPHQSANVPNALAEKIEKLEPGLIKPKAGAEVDPAGNIVVFATSKGIIAVYPDAANALATPIAPAVESAFKLETGFVLPPSKRGALRPEIYPFAQMESGMSFFVAATEERPNPAKALASTVSSASKRFLAVYPEGHEKAGQPTGKDGRKFVVRARTVADGEKTDGARVYCIVVPPISAAV